MSAEKSQAIVLRVIEFSETSCVVTLLTRDFGKITALAKGARRRKSPFEAALDLLAICRIVFLHKTSGAMDLLTEAKLERRFRSASKNLNRLYAAFYILELLRTLTEENDPHPDLFDLAVHSIIAIDQQLENRFQIGMELLRFELSALKILGHLPMLTQCVGCGRQRTTNNRVKFGLNVGGLLCQKCCAGQTNIISVSSEGVSLLLELTHEKQLWTNRPEEAKVQETVTPYSHMSPSRDGGGPSIEVPEQTTEVQKLLQKYITHLLGFPPRMLRFLDRY